MKQKDLRCMSIFLISLLLHSTNLRVQSSKQMLILHQKGRRTPKTGNLTHQDFNYKTPISLSERQLRQVSPKSKKKAKKAQKKTIEIEFRPNPDYKKNVKDSDLLEEEFTPLYDSKEKSSKLKKLNKKENLLNLAKEVTDKASFYDLKIDKVFLGPGVKKIMKDKRLGSDLSKVLNQQSLKPLISKLKKRIKIAHQKQNKRRKLIKQRKAKKQKKKRKRKKLRHKHKLSHKRNHRKLLKTPEPTNAEALNRSLAGSSAAKKPDQSAEKFNFLPGYAGMPFPPFMMNGPHFHPPLNVTVNAIPNRDSKRELNPYEIEEENLKNQQEAMKPLTGQMKTIIEQLGNVTSDINVKLADKYDKVMSLY